MTVVLSGERRGGETAVTLEELQMNNRKMSTKVKGAINNACRTTPSHSNECINLMGHSVTIV